MTMLLSSTVKPKKGADSKQLERGEKVYKNLSTLDRIEGNIAPEDEQQKQEKAKAKKNETATLHEELDGIDLDINS